tara:strand:+ start:1846 stop:2028 length:183 start_codon:yes stop_codon:yes gene_type:complete
LPSAELIIKLGSWGVSLLGSLKNQRIKEVKTKPTVEAVCEINVRIIESDKEIAANLKPSG